MDWRCASIVRDGTIVHVAVSILSPPALPTTDTLGHATVHLEGSIH
ncbi:hypothetical protein [Natrinema sp. HArc-T2]